MFKVREDKRIRIIISTDAKNEADDQYTIAHALLTQKFDVRAIVASHFGAKRSAHSMMDSYEECLRVTECLSSDVPVYRGAEHEIASASEYEYSEGAEAIVREALREDDLPLYVMCLGPITDMACAYLEHPEIASRVTVVWVGGGPYPEGGPEDNLSKDIQAARALLASAIDFVQIPATTYRRVRVSLSELFLRVRGKGRIGTYLYDQLVEFNAALNRPWNAGETWCLGDSTAIGVLLDPDSCIWEDFPAPYYGDDMGVERVDHGRVVHVVTAVDSRLIIEDMYAKLEIASMAGC